MITLEPYASVYMPLIMAMNDARKEQGIAASLGIAHAELMQGGPDAEWANDQGCLEDLRG